MLLGWLFIVWLTVSATLAHDLLVSGIPTLHGATKLTITIAITNTSVRLTHLIVLLTIENGWIVWHCSGHPWREGTGCVGSIFTSGGTGSGNSSGISPWCTNIGSCCRWRSIETLWLLE